MRLKKVTVSITLDGEVAEQIRALAAGQDRSLSQYINRLLKKRLQAMAKGEQKGPHFAP